MNYQGPVRRTDLYLRGTYPEINTIIYRISEKYFLIYCDNVDRDFEEFKKEFDYSIRLISASVDVTNLKPETYLEIIPNISDKEISKGFEGVPMSKSHLLNLILSKFPNVFVYKIEDEPGIVKVYFANFEEIIEEKVYTYALSEDDKGKIIKFLEDFKMPITFKVFEEKIDKSVNLKEYQFHNPVQFIYASNFRRDFKPEYLKRDEALWFENIDSIYEGNFKKDDLYFYNSSEYSCYADYSSFDNIDIRNLLFLFQTVFITLPFERSIEEWLKQSKILKNEFLDLVNRNRIKVVLTQPELRYDVHFINEIYAANPNSVITRRALATLQQIDIVELSDNYILNDLSIIKELKNFCVIAHDITKINPKLMYEMLVWPIKARRNSFESLNNSGLFSMSSFGVNTAVEKRISEAVNKDLSFEFTVNSPSIHLANSLNATYFPFKAKDGYSDSFYANIMGELLNFYKSATTKNIKSFIENKKKINSGILPISPIEVIEINDYLPITELEDVLSKDFVYPRSKRLMEYLSGLSDDERKQKINLYNQEVSKKINKKGSSGDVIDLGTNVVMDAAGAITGFAIIGSTFSLLKLGGKKLTKSIPLIKNIAAKIEEAMYTDIDKANIHYLTKINRVARVRRNI